MARRIKKPIDGRLRKLWKNLSRTVSKWIFVLQAFVVCTHYALAQCRFSCRTLDEPNKQTIYGRLRKLWKNLSRAVSSGYPYYRHPLPVRIMHWSNVVFLAILLMSGLNIFNAHPALYWGKSSYSGVPPYWRCGARKTMKEKSPASPASSATTSIQPDSSAPPETRTGELAERGFPSWLTIPD